MTVNMYCDKLLDLPCTDDISCPFCGSQEFIHQIPKGSVYGAEKCGRCGRITHGFGPGVHLITATNLQIYRLAIDPDTEIKYNEMKNGDPDVFKKWLEEISPIATEFNKTLFVDEDKCL